MRGRSTRREPELRLSVVIVTHDRVATLSRTLDRLAENPARPHDSMEVLVVDNGSMDGTAAAVEARRDLPLKVIRRERNEGVSARNHAFAIARGKYVLLIDDDSYPIGDAAARSMEYLDATPATAAVVGRVELPDGRLEASALPGVVANGAVVLRKRVFEEVGGFPPEFFRQAEEYDLSLRVWNAGHRVERFEDLRYRHEKAPGNRAPAAVHRQDARNNLIVAHRYLTGDARQEYVEDWSQRYLLLAEAGGADCLEAAQEGLAEGLAFCRGPDLRPQPLNDLAFEAVFEWRRQARRVARWAERQGVRRVAIADWSKNILATWRACRAAGLDVRCVVDAHPAFAGRAYRGIPVRASVDTDAVEGVVLSNVNPARVERRLIELHEAFDGPILSLWWPRMLGPGDACETLGGQPGAIRMAGALRLSA